jgi:hypothetical protein
VEFLCEFVVGLLDFALGGAFVDAQYFYTIKYCLYNKDLSSLGTANIFALGKRVGGWRVIGATTLAQLKYNIPFIRKIKRDEISGFREMRRRLGEIDGWGIGISNFRKDHLIFRMYAIKLAKTKVKQ